MIMGNREVERESLIVVFVFSDFHNIGLQRVSNSFFDIIYGSYNNQILKIIDDG